MKTILYTTDCSINDASSLQYAYRFSCIMNAELHILHAYQFPPISFSTIKSPETRRKHFQKEQKEILTTYCETHLKNEFRQKPITTHAVENDSIVDCILDLSKLLLPDLVILGMKDGLSNRGYFSGNIANTLLDKIEVPILIIPNNISYKGFSTILYATDFEEEDFLSIQKIVEIARPFEALIEIIHVFEMDKHLAIERMEKFKDEVLKQVSYPEIVFRTILSGEVKSGLLSVLNRENATMLAMLERKHNWSFSNLFHKDLVKEMEATVSIPILAFNKHTHKTKLQNVNSFISKNILAY